MKRKKILFIMGGLVHYYNPILAALNTLDGYELITLTPETSEHSLGKGVHQSKENLGFQAFFLPEKKGLFQKSFFKGFTRFLATQKPDIIITGWPYSMEILLNPFIRLGNTKVIHKDIPFNLPKYEDAVSDFKQGKVIISENYDKSGADDLKGLLNYRLVTRLRKEFLSRAHAHVCYTRAAYDIFPSYGVLPESIFVIYNSPDTKKLLEASARASEMTENLMPPNPHRLIHVGRLVKWKKVDLLLEAVHKLKERFPSLSLLVVGDGPEKESLQNLSQQLGIEKRVHFAGAVYDPVLLAKYHQESALYVLGGIGGLSINEAMCFGKPVICSVADGTEKMLVHNGKNGYFFENDNLDDLVAKIALGLSSEEKIQEMGMESLRIIHDEVNERKVIEGYQKALDYISSLA